MPRQTTPGSRWSVLVERATEVMDSLALVPLDRAILVAAGALAEPALRALDAIHIAGGVRRLRRSNAFVELRADRRPAPETRYALASLRTVAAVRASSLR